jgi:hypothetical protein
MSGLTDADNRLAKLKGDSASVEAGPRADLDLDLDLVLSDPQPGTVSARLLAFTDGLHPGAHRNIAQSNTAVDYRMLCDLRRCMVSQIMPLLVCGQSMPRPSRGRRRTWPCWGRAGGGQPK